MSYGRNEKSVASNFGSSVNEISLKLVRHMIDWRLLDAYDSPEITIENNLMNKDRSKITFSYLDRLLK